MIAALCIYWAVTQVGDRSVLAFRIGAFSIDQRLDEVERIQVLLVVIVQKVAVSVVSL